MNSIPVLYRKIHRRSTLAVVGCNFLGAGILFFYLSAIDPLPPGGELAIQSISPVSGLFFFGITAVLIILGDRISKPPEKRIRLWIFEQNCDPHSPLLPQVQRDLLNNPLRAALISFFMWIIAATIFSTMSYAPQNFWRNFLVVTLTGGVLTSVMSYFVEELNWRPLLSHLFTEGQLAHVRVFRMPLGRRLMIVFILITIYPAALLSLLTLNRARMLLEVDNPAVVLHNLEALLIFIVLVSVLISVGLAVFVTRSINQPVMALKEKMIEVGKQNFEVQVPVNTTDELGYLSEGFNQMVSGLKRGEMLRNLLNLYVSPEVARQALESGAQLGGQSVKCSVLFSDIRDFTGLSERLEPQMLINLLNRYMTAMIRAIVQHGGMVNKFGGDSLLAVFGTPINPAPDHAARAIQAGLEMQRALQAFNLEQAQNDGPQLRIGIGAACGLAVAGNVGGKERLEYTVIGDTVNLASRLQSLTKDIGHEFLINEEAYQQAGAALSLQALAIPGVQVRGKNTPLTVYAINQQH